jgi:NADH:ubiquinone reductase (H+-translocating)
MTTTTPMPARRRIVVIGGGAGGIELVVRLARRLDRQTDEVVLVDKAPSHFWKPRLHEVAAGLINPGEGAVSYLALARSHGFRFHYGALAGVDPVARVARLSAVEEPHGAGEVLEPRDLAYDDLVLALGSLVNDFGVEGVVEHCHMLDSAEQAAVFNQCFFNAAMQIAEGQRARLAVGIVGAGATGVELAAALRHAVDAMKRYGGMSTGDQLDITVVDMASRVLAGGDARTSTYAAARLAAMGVNIKLNAAVARVSAEGLHLNSGEFVPCDLKVWASGITGQTVVHSLPGLRLGKLNRIVTDGHLACEGVEHLYAMGDCSATPDGQGFPALPATAQVAHQQAAYLADALVRRHGKDVPSFTYRPRGTLVSLGQAEAAGEFPSLRRTRGTFSTHGHIPKLLYVSLEYMHRVALHGWLGASALELSDWLRHTTVPPIKLH